MLEFLRTSGAVSERKRRLCAVSWARSFLHHAADSPKVQQAGYLNWLSWPAWQPQLEAAESYADGQIDRKALRASRAASGGPYNFFRVVAGVSQFTLDNAYHALHAVRQEFRTPPDTEVCDLIRCIFGNPFRPAPSIDLTWFRWNDRIIPRMASAIYEERALPEGTFDPTRLAVLADALEEVGAADPDLLGHLRGPGPHVRGCFAVDAVLGKS
jgi:hypothetical protein